ncbi:MAG: hypothetical protein G01um101433_113 [Parcubacteria group bacterium Gr01-1014_33]|nr:MAG: hypothetical protein G01um101433_113 [Parcubacteria group bacterium Gr01-1014_33]
MTILLKEDSAFGTFFDGWHFAIGMLSFLSLPWYATRMSH